MIGRLLARLSRAFRRTPPAWHFPLCIGCHTRHSKDTLCPDGTLWWALSLVCNTCGAWWVVTAPSPPGITEIRPACPSCGCLGYVKLDCTKRTANGTLMGSGGE